MGWQDTRTKKRNGNIEVSSKEIVQVMGKYNEFRNKLTDLQNKNSSGEYGYTEAAQVATSILKILDAAEQKMWDEARKNPGKMPTEKQLNTFLEACLSEMNNGNAISVFEQKRGRWADFERDIKGFLGNTMGAFVTL